jgi:hypothetical protein
MTNPYAAIPLTYDAIDLQQADFGIYLWIARGLNEPPEVRGKDVVVPGRDGQIPRNRRSDTLRIDLVGEVFGLGPDQATVRADYRTTSRFLRSLFSPARSPADLVALLEDGDTATIAARPLPGMLWNEHIVSEWATISIPLLSVAPDWTFT